MRSITPALNALVLGLFGAGLGPTAVGIASDFFARRVYAGVDFVASCPGGRALAGPGTASDLACRTASTLGLRYALIAMLVMFLWAAVHYALAARRLRQDLYHPEQAAAA